MKMEKKRECTIEVQVEEDGDFLSQVAAIEANALSISSTKRRKIDPEEAYTAALRGLVAVDNSRSGVKVVPARNDGVYASSSCFKCGKSGHWARDCDAIGVGVGVRVGGGGYNGNSGTNSSMPEKPCPCGMGPCLVLTANTQKNPGRKFYKCPLRQENGGCGFFEWCDNASGTNSMVGGKENCGSNSSFPDLPCPCGAGFCLILTAKTGKNIGQQFYRCPANQGSTCGFFRWCNEHNVPADHPVSASKIFNDMNSISNDSYGARTSSSCFKCGKEGHWAKDCSTHHQILLLRWGEILLHQALVTNVVSLGTGGGIAPLHHQILLLSWGQILLHQALVTNVVSLGTGQGIALLANM